MRKRLTNGKVWLDGDFRELDLVIGPDGKVAEYLEPGVNVEPAGDEIIDAGGALVLPGAIDAHAHIEDGRRDFL